MEKKTNKCDIRAEVKLRNGYPNWWCFTHHSPARGDGGKKLDTCAKANEKPIEDSERLYIDLDDYPGGVGIWGALEAVLDTKRDIPEAGVHVHLRKNENEPKIVDNSFKEVYIKNISLSLHEGDTWVKINDEIACAYTASVVFEKKLKIINCKHCNAPHIDAEWFSVHAHKKHMCTYCGRDFIDSEHGISNPIFYVQQLFHEKLKHRKIVDVTRVLDIKSCDYRGGIQIWGSNPAIIWTATKSEEAGIHVHLFQTNTDAPVVDDTYGKVIIDGVELNPQMIRYYMVQRSMPYLAKYVISLNCPKCGGEHFDQGDDAINPHKNHVCEHCNHHFNDGTRFKGVVSNPVVKTLALIEQRMKN